MIRSFPGLVLLLLMLPLRAWSQPIGAIGAQLIVESEERESKYEARVPFMIRAGYAQERNDLLLEYATFGVSTATGSIEIQRRQHAVLAWVQHKLPVRVPDLAPYLAAGAGTQFETVRMWVDDELAENRGALHLVGAVATGVKARLKERFDIGLEIRLAFSETYRPNPALGAAAYLGYRF